MQNTTERSLGHVFGLVGGLLIALGGLVAFVFGVGSLALNHPATGIGDIGEAFLLGVVGVLVLLFSHLGEHAWRDRPVSTGVMLAVLAIVGWIGLDLDTNVLALVGGIFALIAGVLYLIEPAERRASAILAGG